HARPARPAREEARAGADGSPRVANNRPTHGANGANDVIEPLREIRHQAGVVDALGFEGVDETVGLVRPRAVIVGLGLLAIQQREGLDLAVLDERLRLA